MKKMALFFGLFVTGLYAESFSLDYAKEQFGSFFAKNKNLLSKQTNKTVVMALNKSFDEQNIHFETLEFLSNGAKMVVFLNGENTPLELIIEDFNWNESNDGEFLLIENLKFKTNIPWISHSIKTLYELFGERLQIKNKFATKLLLSSMKPASAIKNTTSSASHPNWLLSHPKIAPKIYKEMTPLDAIQIMFELFDPNYLKLTHISTKNKVLDLEISFDKQPPTKLTLNHFTANTANEKTMLVLEKIDLDSSNKPWIKSFLAHKNNEIVLDYDEMLEFIVNELYKH